MISFSMLKRCHHLFLPAVTWSLTLGFNVEISAWLPTLMVSIAYCYIMMWIQLDTRIGTIFRPQVRKHAMLKLLSWTTGRLDGLRTCSLGFAYGLSSKINGLDTQELSNVKQTLTFILRANSFKSSIPYISNLILKKIKR